MNNSLSNVRWLRIISAAVAVIALSFLVLTLMTTIYAFRLAIHAHGSPDQAAISHFASKAGRMLMPGLEALLTVIVAGMVARKTENAGVIHGLLIGLLAGLLGLAMSLAFGGHLNLRAICLFLIVTAAGWLGGFIGRKSGEQNEIVA